MIKIRRLILLILVLFLLLPLQAGERTIPVDVFVMIDKSLSMAEPGKFDSMHQWVRDQLIGQILINDDWITIYQFYGKANNLLTMTVGSEADRQKIIKTVDGIKPDGQYTDIGLALDTIKKALDKRGTNGRHKIMLLLTDLKQEAPWTSRYAGSTDNFESPYLAEARSIKHDNWFEITLDMGIQDMVIKTSKELFSSIEDTRGQSVDNSSADKTDIAGSTGMQTDPTTGTALNNPQGTKITVFGTALPLSIILVLLSLIVFVCGAVALAVIHNRKKEKEKEQTKTQE